MYGQGLSIKHIQESSRFSQGYANAECCRFVGRVSKQSIKCQLYFWILESYQGGTRIGSERDSRPKHITAWTKNAAENFACVCVRPRACVHLHLCAPASVCICVCPHLSTCMRVYVCAQEIKRPDTNSRRVFHSRTFRMYYR